MSVGTGSESAIAEALLNHLGLRHYFLLWLPPTMLTITNPHRTPSCFAQNEWVCGGKVRCL